LEKKNRHDTIFDGWVLADRTRDCKETEKGDLGKCKGHTYLNNGAKKDSGGAP